MSHEALVVGGGIAGASIAILLAQAKRDVVLVEKSNGAHDKICGEFLSKETVDSLEAVGLSLESIGALPITSVRLVGREVIAELNLPFGAMSVSRRVLDEALISHALYSGATVMRGSTVEHLKFESDRWKASIRSSSYGQEVIARSSFLATGKHDLFGRARARRTQSDMVGFKMYFRLGKKESETLNRCVEITLFPEGYCGLSMVDAQTANLSLLIRRRKLLTLGGKWENVLRYLLVNSPHLHRRLEGASELLARPLAISSIPFGYIVDSAADRIWRLGDQAAVIPSFTGSGMAVAGYSAHLAAEMYLANYSADDFHSCLHRRLLSPMRVACALSCLALSFPRLAHGISFWPRALHHIYEATRLPEILDGSYTIADQRKRRIGT